MSKTKLDNSNTRDSFTSNEKTRKPETITMEELLASQTKQLINLSRGQQVEGIVIQKTEKELTLDLGAKSEGVLPARGSESSKVGDKLKVFVTQTESDSGQVILSLQKSLGFTRDRQSDGGKFHSRGGRFSDWNKFMQAQSQKSKLQGTVLEINKGGLIVEVESTRGFLPNSQVGFELLSKSGQGLDKLIGQKMSLTVIEVDSNNNKLIFSQRGQVNEEVKNKLKQFQLNQKVKGKIVAVLPFGLVVSVKDRSSSGRDDMGVEGLVFISDTSWEKVEDLTKEFTVNTEIEVLVIGIDESFGRLNLSIKQLLQDPFSKLAEKYIPDASVKAEVLSVSEEGVVFKLEQDVESLLPTSKMEAGVTYAVGNKITVLIDSVDTKRRKITLAPFITSTEGLIYK